MLKKWKNKYLNIGLVFINILTLTLIHVNFFIVLVI